MLISGTDAHYKLVLFSYEKIVKDGVHDKVSRIFQSYTTIDDWSKLGLDS